MGVANIQNLDSSFEMPRNAKLTTLRAISTTRDQLAQGLESVFSYPSVSRPFEVRKLFHKIASRVLYCSYSIRMSDAQNVYQGLCDLNPTIPATYAASFCLIYRVNIFRNIVLLP